MDGVEGVHTLVPVAILSAFAVGFLWNFLGKQSNKKATEASTTDLDLKTQEEVRLYLHKSSFKQ
jgi:hypothetical protein